MGHFFVGFGRRVGRDMVVVKLGFGIAGAVFHLLLAAAVLVALHNSIGAGTSRKT